MMLSVGPLEANCYLVYDERTKEAAVIDPGAEGKRILREIDKHDLKVKYIINTHGHADHIGANLEVKNSTGASLMVHEDDAAMLTDAHKNFSALMGIGINKPAPDVLLHEGDVIEVGTIKLNVAHTPGHTKGGICLINEEVCFSGDTLFTGSIGRTDFPGGSYSEIIESIRTKLMPLDDKLIVYPGHGPATTIGQERRSNPFLAR